MRTGEAAAEAAFDLDHADSLDLLRGQTSVLELIAAGAPLAEVLTRVVVALEELIEGSRCSILLLDPATATLHHGAAPSLPAAYSALIDGRPTGPEEGSCGAAAYLGRPVIAADIRVDPRWRRFRELAEPHGMRSCWSTPILGLAGIVGTFAVYHDQPHHPSVRERRLVDRFTHLASVAIDHAELFRARLEAEVARSAAEQASRAKSEFVAALNHELRTPLQAITGFTELLRTLDLPPERRQAALEHIGAATEHVLSMVDDLLDIAKIEAEALPLQVEPVELPGLLDEVLALLAPLAAEHDVTLRPAAEVGRAAVLADRRRLRQVLINLVTNGVRYNHGGGWVEIGAAASGPSALTVTVSDSGCGIAPELMSRLFTPFDRLGAERSAEPGAGLGLVVARGLTEAMGGTLELRSAAEAGTTAEITLPRSPLTSS
ncbi:MAG TPA: GAF domain-containing sensor histidine kinase [Trebonia sp.]|jgi:two-component system cell cycle sensor histidine kinase PleC|nr:GAF domain-containing sensor histidine kinase [Trebonia sp.]